MDRWPMHNRPGRSLLHHVNDQQSAKRRTIECQLGSREAQQHAHVAHSSHWRPVELVALCLGGYTGDQLCDAVLWRGAASPFAPVSGEPPARVIHAQLHQVTRLFSSRLQSCPPWPPAPRVCSPGSLPSPSMAWSESSSAVSFKRLGSSPNGWNSPF